MRPARTFLAAALILSASATAAQAAEYGCAARVFIPSGHFGWQFPQVDAANPQDAEQRAIQSLRSQFSNPLLRFEVEECWEVRS